MEFLEFIKSRFCKPLVLPEEDCPQDVTEWRRLVREDQQRQFEQYVGGTTTTVEKTDEERRVEEFLASKNLPVRVPAEPRPDDEPRSGNADDGSMTDTDEARESTSEVATAVKSVDSRGGQKFDKVAYQREYMRKRRAAQKAQ